MAMVTTLHFFLLVLYIFDPLVVYGFQGTVLKTNQLSLHQSVTTQRRMVSSNDQEYMPLTPMQIKTIRKEISKRRSRKQLSQEWLPESETIGPFSEDTLANIAKLLEKNEVVEVRGISKDDKRDVFGTSEELAYYLSNCLEKNIERVETKGHTSVFYCPGKTIKLRTNYRSNQWSKRPKPLRDNSGQIIKTVRKMSE
mmetsp:Transcript_10578/g.15570  ORF Transcript_10578/g.15570 Transcript_10578/m.15570 type:complete len:197 (+) Transcript_10578:166-756(+)|eukprot:CAMPEP_0194211466 /NCGR_PEP_ID=MMETSP0156-20130528/10336_1 /TAXON_ID=33649 /ORGANISM="Thalassionema nitzschioides, Strain L26-B" /LENGTH=196 /DNA_ID=CAMNT_0038939015 /DNA_START=98 /DNA_END=688 /DNA_ORIENTATION=-